jgi:ferritin
MSYLLQNPAKVGELAAQHLLLTGLALLLAVAIALPVGVSLARRPRLYPPVMAVLSTLYTIPSISLLVLLIPLLGLGFWPTIVALVVYCQAILVRNVVAGINQVDPATVEAARGMGFSDWQVLRHVELPLALPVILAGVRIAAISTIAIATIAARHHVSTRPWYLTIQSVPVEVAPMISEQMQQALNEQIKHEFFSSFLYLSMAAHFESASLPGFAHWMKLQAREEQEHAMKFFDYIHSQGGRVTLQALEQPQSQFGSPRSVFEATLEHERKVTSLIWSLNDLALQERDFATQGLLQWFIQEQVEEERTATEIIEQLKMVGDHGAALFMVNAQLARRGS